MDAMETTASPSSSEANKQPAADKPKPTMAYLCKGLNAAQLLDLLEKVGEQCPAALDVVKSETFENQDRCKCFIRNLNFSTTVETLTAAFQVFGPVREIVVLRRGDGTSKGYGFVLFENLDGAETAVSSCKPHITIDGRQVNVYLNNDQQQSKPNHQQQQPQYQQQFGGFRQPYQQQQQQQQQYTMRSPMANPQFQRNAPQIDQRRLFVRGLAWSVDDQKLRAAFQCFGPIEDASVIRQPDGKSKGFGFVVFHRADHAQVAGTHAPPAIDGRPINAHMAAERNPVQGGQPIGQQNTMPMAQSPQQF